MTSEGDLGVDMGVVPAEPRRSCAELFLSQLSVADTIQACRGTHREEGLTVVPHPNQFKCFIPICITVFFRLHKH